MDVGGGGMAFAFVVESAPITPSCLTRFMWWELDA